MLLFGVFLLSYVYAQNACDLKLNDATTGLNYGCNDAGVCTEDKDWGDYCRCCSPDNTDLCGKDWICNSSDPVPECFYWTGSNCKSVSVNYYGNFGFRLEQKSADKPADINCSTVPALRAVDNQTLQEWGTPSVLFTDQVTKLLVSSGYDGIVVANIYCDTCSEEYPCETGVNKGETPTKGTSYAFQVLFNSFYDKSCLPTTFYMSIDDVPDCEANFDFGGSAKVAFDDALDDEDKVLEEMERLCSDELGWTNTNFMGFKKTVKQEFVTRALTYSPSADPTNSPTAQPTNAPTDCGPYLNEVTDLSFLGVGSDCRGGLDESYPGGLTCDSPYVICLPQENTPAEFDDQAYKSSTHRYSVDECLKECANDQRCSGIEFKADSSSSLGDCNLIDDIPVVISSNMNSSFSYDNKVDYDNLDSSIIGGDALCFEKKDYCNPYFEADDLNNTMLNCYCPNNRKGFYTKKVKRTAANTRFCGNDAEVDTRVKKAQANRMFHLCENWCLFETADPMAEAWYWDPWKVCFREQRMEVGVHMSYCNRVIRSPDTIEMQFINRRVELQCP